MKRLFGLGQITATPAASELLADAGVSLASLIERHVTGDWGIVDSGDIGSNERSIADKGWVLSTYRVKNRIVWVTTMLDQRQTLVYLPGDI